MPIALPPPLCDIYKPSRLGLLHNLVTKVDGKMLESIAYADYGFGVHKNLEALRVICRKGDVPAPMKWEPRDVLQLRRWSEIDSETDADKSLAVRFHIERLFCCTSLLIASPAPENEGCFEGDTDTLIQFIESALKLPAPLITSAGEFLAWRLTDCDNGVETPYFACGIFILLMHQKSKSLKPESIDLIVSWLENLEATARENVFEWNTTTPEWLIGISYDDHRRRKWYSHFCTVRDLCHCDRLTQLVSRMD